MPFWNSPFWIHFQRTDTPLEQITSDKISGHQQSWGYEDGPWKGPGPALLVAADF